MFGGAGVANATAASAPAPSSTMTTGAEDNGTANDQDSDKTGLWGLVGLLGVLGLAGLKRRNDTNDARFAAGPRRLANPNTPGARAKLTRGDSDD